MGKKEDEQLQSMVKTLVTKLCLSEEFISQLTEIITVAIDEKYNKQFQVLKEENAKLKAQLKSQEEVNKTLVVNQERMEQVMRYKTLRFYGIKENQKENPKKIIMEIISNKLGIKIKETKIESCFRVGKLEKDKVRPILVIFSRIDVKQNVFGNKKKLKGTKVVIREDLTNGKLRIFKIALKQMEKKGLVWTNNCSIYAKYDARDEILKISNEEDAQNL